MRQNIFLTALFAALFISTLARAEVVVLDKDGWKVGIGGIVEFDGIVDNKGGFEESPGNKPVAQTGYDSTVGRTQFSVRNSRFGISATAPEENGITSRGYLEFDLLGYDPNPYDDFVTTNNTGGGGATVSTDPANNESAFFANPTLRLRHAYVSSTMGSQQILVGQTWSLFGWQPAYVLSTITVQAVSGTAYERTPQIMYMYKQDGETNTMQYAVSVSKPNERNSMTPNVEAGVRWANKGRTSGFAAANSDIKMAPLSAGLSGAARTYQAPLGSNPSTATAVAIDAQVPLVAGDADSAAGSLTLTAEYSTGSGYGDEFPGWTGNLAQYSNKASASLPNLDRGLAAYDSNGNLTPVKLDSLNVQLQYHLKSGFFDVGYGALRSSNVANLNLANPYDRAETYFVNYLHNCTSHLRVGLEYAQFVTHYAGGTSSNAGSATDNREMLASYYRF